MKKLFLLTTTLLLIGSAQAQLSPAFTARLQTVLDSICNRYHIRGTSAAVLVPGAGTWKGVNGISYTGRPMTSDMLLGVGSNTKTYMATLMLLLEEQGRLSIDDTIGKWFMNQPHVPGSITIRQLLNHTSGLYDYTQHPDFQDSLFEDPARIWQPEAMLQFIDTPYFAPGLRHEYSNTNYLLAGLIVKRMTNQPLSAVLRQYVLAPGGLNNTILFPDEAPTADVAYPWSYVGNGSYQEDLFNVYGYSNNAFFSMANSAGAIMTTAEENAQFWHRLIAGNILSPASMSKLHTYVPVASTVGYGLGIYRYKNAFSGHTIYTHGGTLVGYINENAVDSVTGVTITVLTNQDSIRNNLLLGIVVRALHNVTLQMPPMAVAEAQAQAAGIRCYPNPAQGVLHMAYTGKAVRPSFQLVDITGRTAAVVQLNNGENTLATAGLAPGIYQAFLQSPDQGRVYVQKVVIE